MLFGSFLWNGYSRWAGCPLLARRAARWRHGQAAFRSDGNMRLRLDGPQPWGERPAEALQHGCHRQHHLHHRKARSNADVRPQTEGNIGIGRQTPDAIGTKPVWVETLRVLEEA